MCNYTGELVEKIYDDVVQLILGGSDQDEEERVERWQRGDRNRPANDRARQPNNRPPNRNERRRHFYARCQDLLAPSEVCGPGKARCRGPIRPAVGPEWLSDQRPADIAEKPMEARGYACYSKEGKGR